MELGDFLENGTLPGRCILYLNTSLQNYDELFPLIGFPIDGLQNLGDALTLLLLEDQAFQLGDTSSRPPLPTRDTCRGG